MWINPLIAISLKTRLPEGYCNACARWARFFCCHRGGGCTDSLGPPSLLAAIFRAQASKAQGPIVLLRIIIRAQASKAQGPIDFLRIIIFNYLFFFLFNHPGTFGGLNVLKNS